MQRAMLRLDALVRRRRTVVLVVWGLVLVAAVPLAMHQSDRLTGGGFEVPGSQSAAVQHAVAGDFERGQATTLAAVLVPREGATPARLRAALGRLGAAAADTGGKARLAPAARAAALRALAADGVRPLIVPLATTVSDGGSIDLAVDLRRALGISDRRGEALVEGDVATHLIGQGALWAGMQDLTKEDLLAAETTGFPIVLLILLAVFGSLVAAVLPLALGLVSVTVTGALIYLLSLTTEMSVFVTNMASMIGIGVAVDYSLFVLARYREEIADGRTPEEARGIALATSGVAVTFSGLAVIVSLAGLFVVNVTSLRSMAMGAILVVAVAVLAAATLLPALISLAGRRAYERGRIATVSGAIARRLRVRRGRGDAAAAGAGGAAAATPGGSFWDGWTARVTRRPVVSAVAAASVLIVLALPVLSIETGNGALEQFPRGHETRVGAETAASLTGAGAATPIEVVVPGARAQEAIAVLRADRQVARVEPPVAARDGDAVLIGAIPAVHGESAAAQALVERLRGALPEGALVGGSPADTKDFLDRVSGSMWLVIAFVLGLSYLVLLVLLRSVVLPLKAVLMNLLSVGASLGVLVAIFQWGWIDGFLGFQSPGHIDALTPPLVLAVVFGLSMDYEVFLLSRIRERWTATGDTQQAVADGLRTSAKTITSAALIMVAVFAVFVGTGVPSIKELGLGCAIAIALDATLVRLVLVPAAMELLGRWNWWLPRPLARVIPDLAIEDAPLAAAGR
ncbi:MMPL family transporter [Conexibacter woesei]|uniref:Drug exporter-like proteinr of the RND superfamily n=1 Tax=Conexibacter woesei (strain DSM 14684 / CCUG 47730 / CIP 108061 / JCM 11494 / NBRC 100937 / ID131577) TaxID=469383 RepID=D3FDQ0_CONWI|nr:MMPL family transporter [Conexibacter woesei]ADB49624.1 drug exporter-like proteinr of the RND superfamily [Conexibacter woesei DSM 14684]